MGERARQYFDEAERSGGLVAKMRLASLAQITSTEAAAVDDSPELLRRLAEASSKVLEGGPRPAERRDPTIETAPRTAPSDARVLRRYLATCVELISQRALFLGDVSATVRRIDEAASDALDVARVSVWFLDTGRTKITCADLFERAERRHSTGVELFAKDFGPYFQALATERTIAAHDAQTDPRTSCFTASYLQPLGIGAMLDVPIWHAGQMVGVVCHEHLGGPRTWTADEESFAYVVANLVALALDQQASHR
ncbi:MAG: GAF domain-containing protein [Sandaracinus sp.]